MPSVIAIDGPVASGKTSVGLVLARRLGYRFLDTGQMYRAVTLAALERGVPLDDDTALGSLADGLHIDVVPSVNGDAECVLADGEDITAQLRDARVEDAVSLVARAGAVRRALVTQQQRMAAEGRIVMVGRDIGTKVLPHAAKVFLEASKDERAMRRFREATELGVTTTLEAVRKNLELRDRLDSERTDSPLRAAEDAVRVQTEGLEVEGVVEHVLAALGGARDAREAH